MTDPITDAERHTLRGGVLMLVVLVVQALDLILDSRIKRFASEDGRAFREAADLAAGGATAICGVLLVVLGILVIRRRRPFTRDDTPGWVVAVMVAFLAAASVSVLMNIATLVVSPSLRGATQPELIGDLALLYASTTLIFSLWYQLADVYLHGGAFEFPPNAAHPEEAPRWFDYLSLSFYTNSTFGPTLESVKTRPAKALMMVQTSLSLVVLVVLIARIIRGI
ncbi:MAG: hypothetical protein ACKO72_11720 [Actinomycetes bacterium]